MHLYSLGILACVSSIIVSSILCWVPSALSWTIQKPVPWAALKKLENQSYNPLRERLLSCISLCLLYCGSFGASIWHQLFCSQSSRVSINTPRQVKHKSIPWEAPLKSQNVRYMVKFSVFLPGRSQEMGVSSQLCAAVPGRGIMTREYQEFS